MRESLKTIANNLAGRFGVKMVNVRWGPRGPMNALRRVRALGVVPRQVVDVGASNGTWTRECLQIFPESRYFLVDPLPENVAPLNLLASQHRNIHIWNGALGREPGTLELHTHGDQSSFLASDSFRTETSQQVEIRMLDSFLGSERLDPPDLIKADVQGYELEVLHGATRCLAAAQLLLLEVSYRRLYKQVPLAHEVITAAADWGFRIYDICTYLGRPSDGELVQSDILFAREGSKVFSSEDYV